jgi:tRNA(fMet)-specific endonuclease VapC
VIVLDTDIVTLVLWDSGEVGERLADRIDSAADEICVSIVGVEEQLRGWLSWISSAKSDSRLIEGYSRLHRFIDQLDHFDEILDFNTAAVGIFDQLRRKRIRIGTLDLRIAAIALANDALLISRNLVDFQKVPGLRVEDWTVN